jgi:hypothetical protein
MNDETYSSRFRPHRLVIDIHAIPSSTNTCEASLTHRRSFCARINVVRSIVRSNGPSASRGSICPAHLPISSLREDWCPSWPTEQERSYILTVADPRLTRSQVFLVAKITASPASNLTRSGSTLGLHRPRTTSNGASRCDQLTIEAPNVHSRATGESDRSAETRTASIWPKSKLIEPIRLFSGCNQRGSIDTQ